MTFTDLKLIQPLMKALDQIGYSEPSPIQQLAIPEILAGKDIFGCAQTGTGKTAAFALPLLQLLNESNKPAGKMARVLILAPTRELATQITDNIKSYSKNLSFSILSIFGGVSQVPQVNKLRSGVDILVATPGRLLDLMNQGHVKLNAIEHLVLDEADRMLDMGFIKDIQRILLKLPVKKQVLFFSATVSPDIKKLANSILRNPVQVNVAPPASIPSLVQQSLYYVRKDKKRSLLTHVIGAENIEHALVFTRTKRGADKVAKDLNKGGIRAEAIHGNKSQGARERALDGFKSKTIRVLVATDIASRGIDIDKLSFVINYEIPEQAETYVHRIGRTGRAGSNGRALSFCSEEEVSYLSGIHKLIRKNIEVVKQHPFN